MSFIILKYTCTPWYIHTFMSAYILYRSPAKYENSINQTRPFLLNISGFPRGSFWGETRLLHTNILQLTSLQGTSDERWDASPTHKHSTAKPLYKGPSDERWDASPTHKHSTAKPLYKGPLMRGETRLLHTNIPQLNLSTRDSYTQHSTVNLSTRDPLMRGYLPISGHFLRMALYLPPLCLC